MSIVNRAMGRDSPVNVIIGIFVLVASIVTFGLVNIQVLNSTISPYAGWIFVGGFVMVYFISDREIGDLQDYELGALLIPVLSVITMKVIPEFESLVNEFHPYSGIVLFALTLISYYTLSTNMRLGVLAFQLIVGGILALTAALQFGLVSIDVLGTQIESVSVWIFLLALASAYFLSEHTIGKMDTMEVGALVIGAGSYIMYTYAPPFRNFVMNNNPITGIVLTLVVVIAYVFIMRNGELR